MPTRNAYGYFFVNGALKGERPATLEGRRVTLRDEATLRDQLNRLTPRLRRYARALTTGSAAPSELADDLVHATLMRAVGARYTGAPDELGVRLYATVTQLNRDVAVSKRQARVAGAGPILASPGRGSPADHKSKLATGLLALPLEAREALLLVGLEGFDHAEAARILRISHAVLMSRLSQARSGLDASFHKVPRPVAAAGARSSRASQPMSKPASAHLRLVSSRP